MKLSGRIFRRSQVWDESCFTDARPSRAAVTRDRNCMRLDISPKTVHSCVR